MKKTREILRLAHEVGLTNRQIARSLCVSPTTVGECLRRARVAAITWPLAEEMDDEVLEGLLYGEEGKKEKPLPDMKDVHTELSRKGVTLALLWEEYAAEHPQDHYSYAQFTRHYRRWAGKLELSMRQAHKAGEKLFCDFAGQRMRIVDPQTGEITEAPVFVAAMGFSSFTYAEACPSEELVHWIGAHADAISYLGGVPHILVPDNTKVAVTSPCRYEPDLNPTYAEMAAHYGCAVIPARVGKPKDKAKVENAVLQVERWVIAPLRDRTFFSLAEANLAISERLDFLNDRTMKGLGASRRELFCRIDRPALLPLPSCPYEFATFKRARVNIDYHVEVEGHYYSVPYRLVHERVEVRLTQRTLEVYHRGKRVASHPRSYAKGRATTQDDHRPASHRACLEWTPSRIISWAERTGPATAELVSAIMASKPHPEMGFRSCLGIIRLSARYSPERVEAAAARALAAGAVSYKSVKSILSAGLDGIADEEDPLVLPEHENIRGPEYYN